MLALCAALLASLGSGRHAALVRRVARSYRRARALEAAHLRLLQDHYDLGAAIVRARGQRARR